jgi:3-methylcrotonyl-CoA carboxylase alpha subunit
MIAKFIAHGATRAEARDNLAASLRALDIAGIRNNRDFLVACLTDDTFADGDVSTSFIDRRLERLLEPVVAGQ